MLAHVDAGKTTLAEALLYRAGAIRKLGRVDHGDSFLDASSMERERGITIFSSQAVLDYDGVHLMLVDTPGHVDFGAEAERTLQVLDCAVLVVGANDGVRGHTLTLWRLLERYGVPTVIFVNKCDLESPDREATMVSLRDRLSQGCVDCACLFDTEAQEAMAILDESALDEYLDAGVLSVATVRRLVAERRAHPVFFGSALRLEGVDEFLDGLCGLVAPREHPKEFAARVYKVTHEARGERVSWLKVTGGCLRTRDLVKGVGRRDGRSWADKVSQLRIYSGAKFDSVDRVGAGQVCAACGLAHALPGDALGAEPQGSEPTLAPVLSYSVEPGQVDAHRVHEALARLAEEDPLLGVVWNERLQEVRLQLMGPIQLEVVRQELEERFGMKVGFGPGGIMYRETIAEAVRGVGHFEPLRHYAEVQLLIEPLPRGSGVVFGTRASEDDLDRNWQRLILTNAMERPHLGVLTGSPLTDVRVTLLGGRAHSKHTEGGDFRQATYRAVRQALMGARSVLLEPWYRFSLELPQDQLGRGMSDLQRMGASFGAPAMCGGFAALEGRVPASECQEYAIQVSAYSSGRGHFSLAFDGYDECHDADRVVEEASYDPEADLPNTPDSVFCAHGAGYTVKWRDVPEHAHVQIDPARLRPWRAADAAFFSSGA